MKKNQRRKIIMNNPSLEEDEKRKALLREKMTRLKTLMEQKKNEKAGKE